HPTALSGGDTQGEIEIVRLPQLLPLGKQILLILGGGRERAAIVNAVAVEKHPVNPVTGVEHGAGKTQRGSGTFRGVGGAVDDEGELHPSKFLLPIKKCPAERGTV